jgi:hypothetical protein
MFFFIQDISGMARKRPEIEHLSIHKRQLDYIQLKSGKS